ncbi:helix-turn-helix transcriptional regulator [Ottowia thiooxydans]|uniref:helix-turn-helix transcriptional regulator n=1 Tax=Ottowia thiooxydans TaxID=219182 RepID=UPI000422053A|nr:helix-turn-helix transcriptional regulator [Ottowia thiooxydans]
MITVDRNLVLQRQLLLQLGDRLKRLRKAQALGTVEVAARAGITRNTLRAIENGDPSPSMGNYVRVMSVLGISGDLALLAGDTFQPAPAGSAAALSRRAPPIVQIHVTASQATHQLQDLQSLALHEEAVRLAKISPGLVNQAQETLQRWLAQGDSRSAILWHEWENILKTGAWRKVLGPTRRAQQLRQSSPLVTILPDAVRQQILLQVSELKNGIDISGGAGNETS